MSENKMGDRGSKSDFKTKFVKEQRVNGNWCGIIISHLRCTLMGFERNYQVKILSNLLNKKLYSTFYLSPWFWSGLIDASILKKSVIVWGTNLQSTVGVKFTRKQLAMVELPPYQKSVIIGVLLSDGWLTFSSKANKNARLGFKQSGARYEYFWFIFCILSHYCSSSPCLVGGVRAGNRFYALQIFTRAMPCLTELHSLFYPNGIKIIPHNIYNMLTPVALAHLIMGDGSAKQYSLKICTDSYTVADIIRLMNVLIIRYELDCTLRFHTPTQPRIHYPVKILSKQINKYRSYTTITPQLQINLPKDFYLLNPNFVTGFIDAEGCFMIKIWKNPKSKIGWTVQAEVSIGLHQKDRYTLELIKFYFGGLGDIYKQGKDSVRYRVSSLQDLINVIIPHFDKYPLNTQKKADFILWKKVIELMKNKEHLTQEGLWQIVAIRASINLGLSSELKAAFSDIVPVSRSLFQVPKILDPYWFAGFVSGEGCFLVNIYKSKTKLGQSVQLIFQITQHIRDEVLIKSLVKYLGCGKVYTRHNQAAVDYKVTNFSDNFEKLIPFFMKYPIIGVKYRDFEDFKKVVLLVKDKAHLTPEGLEEIRKIKASMNRSRTPD